MRILIIKELIILVLILYYLVNESYVCILKKLYMQL